LARQAHALLFANTRSRERARWLRLPGGRRELVVDIDQRSLAVRGRQFELAEAGFFGRNRGRQGYQLTRCYLGGDLREGLDEHVDPGATPATARLTDVLEAVARLCEACGIEPADVLVRADAVYGTAAVIAAIQGYGFQFLLKGISPQRGEKLLGAVGPAAVFERTSAGEAGEARWVTDLGWRAHDGKGEARPRPSVQARTISGVWVHEVRPRRQSRPRSSLRARLKREGRARERRVRAEYWLTSLEGEDLPAPAVVEIYNDRQRIEAYFRDEQQALGARHVRRRAWAGAAVFEWLVAMTNTVLRWTMGELLAGTPVEEFGLTRVVKEVMQIPARLVRRGRTVRIIVPSRHALVRRLLTSASPFWSRLAVATSARARTPISP
jgi:DDE family transposase